VIFVGHSHMVCVLNAAQTAGLPFQAVTLKAIKNPEHAGGLDLSKLIDDPGKPDFSDETKALLARNEGPVYCFVSGIRHVQLGLRRLDHPSEPAFDFVLPEAPHLPLEEGAEVIPFDAMRDVVRREFSSRMKHLRRVTELAPGPVFHFAPPPPASDRWIARLIQKHVRKHPTEALPGLPSGLVRWKLWRLTTEVFREYAERFGARFVDCPREAVDANGFMRDELVRNVTHGNEDFGVLVLDQIRSLR
jgi:hypothetical protein